MNLALGRQNRLEPEQMAIIPTILHKRQYTVSIGPRGVSDLMYQKSAGRRQSTTNTSIHGLTLERRAHRCVRGRYRRQRTQTTALGSVRIRQGIFQITLPDGTSPKPRRIASLDSQGNVGPDAYPLVGDHDSAGKQTVTVGPMG